MDGSSTASAYASEEVDVVEPTVNFVIQNVNDAEHRLLDDVWRLVKQNALDSNFNGLDWDAIRSNAMREPLSNREATYNAARKMLRLLDDRYTRFLTPDAFAKMAKFDITGTGILLMPDPVTKNLVVASPPRKGSAAELANLRRGDLVIEIDGQSTAGLTPLEVSAQLTGEEGTTLRLRVSHGVEDEGKEVELVRHFVVTNPVSEAYVTAEGIGYIRLTEFNADCSNAVRRAVQNLVAQGANSFVLDMRGNPGGVLEGAIEIGGLFLPHGSVVAHIVDGHGDQETFYAMPSEIAATIADDPVAVVTNAMSASSSEVLAGALRDNCRARTVGRTSFGKGIIQGVFGLSDGSGVVLTVAKYQTPNHHEIQGKGIAPDIPLRVPSGWRSFNPRRVEVDVLRAQLKTCADTERDAEDSDSSMARLKTASKLNDAEFVSDYNARANFDQAQNGDNTMPSITSASLLLFF
eukprot:CAMPEP_0185850996 /NCGR_PEP_ID=MMETSP1354-20130828/4904_1 /TAXON_ID=708628 /ORGANISM="Erythrolobus madagascarensis, Strain CCMP3276" /LENGTH=463 /DNA_ID=CAMNT_0028551733 /DNA_START=83 /DNA_END=1474 /DNA_ORIENTATION=-